jgi:hypothetical protein
MSIRRVWSLVGGRQLVSASGDRDTVPSANGPRVNFYTVNSQDDPTVDDSGFQIDEEPVFDNASWIPYGSIDLVEFGEWYDVSGDFFWRPTEPGAYVVGAYCQVQLDGPAHQNTRLRLGTAVTPYDFFEGQKQSWGFQVLPVEAFVPARAYSDVLHASARAIEEGKAYFTASGFINVGGSEVPEGASWSFSIFQLDPGSATDQWADL